MAGTDGAVEFLTTPLGIALLSVASLLFAVAVLYLASRVLYPAVRWLLERARWVGTKAVPEGPTGVLAVCFAFVFLMVFGLAGPVPDAVGPLGGDAGGAAGTAGGFLDEAFQDGEPRRLEDGTVVLGSAAYERPRPDTAGDRLRDDWLRAGETPGGAPLENGSVERLDLYVYVVHGSNVDPLTPAERRQLQAVWAEMPVDNPDGSTGVDIHVESGGDLGEPVRFGAADGDDHTRYYTREVMGPRRCRHHLVVLGEPTSRYGGWAASPGYSSFVTGVRNPDHEGDVSPRVRVMTHELLHNVVGRMDDPGLPDRGAHTREGWLGGGEFMTDVTADHLSENRFRGSGFYQNEVCADGGADGVPVLGGRRTSDPATAGPRSFPGYRS